MLLPMCPRTNTRHWAKPTSATTARGKTMSACLRAPCPCCTLCARGHLLAVATGKSRRGLDEVLQREIDGVVLSQLFEASRTADQTAGKPDPFVLTTSKTAAEVATALRAKTAFSTVLTWSAPGAMPDARALGLNRLYTFEQGRATTGTAFNPASRQFGSM